MLPSFIKYWRHRWMDDPDRWDPLLAVYYLTYACDFRCPYCSDGAGAPYWRSKAQMLDPPEALALLRTIRRHSEHLVLTGGEPLKHPGLEQILRGIPALRFRHVILTTNGHDLEPLLPALSPALHELVVSVDTLDEAKADRWYGAGPGALGRILDGIERAAAVRRRSYDVVISAVVTPDNIEDLRAVYDWSAARGFRFAACPQLVGVKAHPALGDMPAYRELFDFLLSEKRRGGRVEGTLMYLEYMRDLRWFACRPFTMVAVAPDGGVFYPCLELGNIAGNLRDEPDLHRLRVAGRERFGPQPRCDTRCHSACALGFSLLMAHPGIAFSELGLGLKRRFARRRAATGPGGPSGGSR